MRKLFKIPHGYLPTLFKTPNFLTPISQLHDPAKAEDSNSKLEFIISEVSQVGYSKPINEFPQSISENQESSGLSRPSEVRESTVKISHPWPEWIDLMEFLLKRGYLEADGNPFKDTNRIRTACLNFSRERPNLIRDLSRKDIHVIAACGCPSIDRKVVNSGKRLRAYVGIDEGNVCSACNLRGNCERAYVKALEYEGGRTIDVMRVVLTYGLDHITDAIDNKPCLNKTVKRSVQRLLKEMVDCSTRGTESYLPGSDSSGKITSNVDPSSGRGPIKVPMKLGDWHCLKCNFLNFARNIRCLHCDGLSEERLKQIREDQDHPPLKKGDWICERCNFLNFARNTRCLLCKEKPPKRQLNPGEWECESCNYINFRKNMVCLNCDHRRPKASNTSSTLRPQLEQEDYHSKNRLKLVSNEDEFDDQAVAVKDRHSENKGATKWRFVEDDNEGKDLLDDSSGFVDFPIVGGRSNLSRDAGKRETWKLQILEKNKEDGKALKSDDNVSNMERRSYFLVSDNDDDEDIAEWFGHRKTETRSVISLPGK